MNEWVREELIDELTATQVAEIAGELETDDAVALIEDMEEEDQRAVLRALDPDDRAAIEEALSYPEESAGRLMRRDAVAVPEHWTIGQVIDFCRAGEDLATDFFEIFVVDPAHRPVGTCLLSWILRTPRRIAIADVMQREQTLIPVDMDQEEVALRFQKYALVSAAVVDPAGRLVGMITADDIVHIVQEEASEDALLMSGAGVEGDINEPVRDSYKARVRWLIANLATALVGSTIIAFFGAAIEQMVALAVLMPIVASIGGNAGTQTMAVSVRALGDEPAHPLQHLADDLARDFGGAAQRAHHRGAARARRGPGLLQPASRPGHRRRDPDQHPRRRPVGRRRAGAAGAERAGPGRLLLGVRDDDHRFDGLPRLPRPRRRLRAGRLSA